MKIKKPRSKTPKHSTRRTESGGVDVTSSRSKRSNDTEGANYRGIPMAESNEDGEGIVCKMVTKCENCIWPPSMHGEKDVALEDSRLAKVKSFNLVWQLWCFFGFTGAHHFYLGRPAQGALYACTGGFFGLGWLLDSFMLRYYIAEANRGVSREAGVEISLCRCCCTFAFLCIFLFGGFFAFYVEGPYLIRKSGVMGDMESPYDVLNVRYGANHDEVKQAFRRESKIYHPDKCKLDDCNERMIKLNAAYKELKETKGLDSEEGSFLDNDHTIQEWTRILKKLGENIEAFTKTNEKESTGNDGKKGKRTKRRKKRAAHDDL